MIELGRKKENKMKKRNCIIGQSGGPTAAINASLSGVLQGILEVLLESFIKLNIAKNMKMFME